MVLNTITKTLFSSDSKYPKEFQNIIAHFTSDYNLKNKEEELIWKAYLVGEKAHEGQTRVSGEKYFDHCIEVCKQLIDWKHEMQNN